MNEVTKTHRKVTFKALISMVTAIALLFTSVLSGFGEVKAKAADVTVITTQAQLAAIANNLRGSYELGCDIALTGAWTPIGPPTINSDNYITDGSGFEGVFNGKGHKITGLSVTGSNYTYATGLFASTYNATIENVGVFGTIQNNNNSQIYNPLHKESFSSYNGGLVGYAVQSTIRNCYSGVSVAVPYVNHSYIGGLVGATYKGKVLNCYASGPIDDGNDTLYTTMAGGLIGEAASELVYNCFAFGVVNLGGELIGRSFNPDGGTCQISSCYALNSCPIIKSVHTTVSGNCVSFSSDDMKAASFVDTLNAGITSDTTDTGLIPWSADSLNANSGYPVYKTLEAADNLVWSDGFRALWDAVPGAAGYTVKLYKSGTTGAVDTETVTDASYDFTSKVTETGTYTFTVTALGDGTTVWDSPESSASAAKNYLKPLPVPATLSWDTGTPGKATWGAVTGAAGYTVALMKSGKALALDRETVAAGTTSFDFTGKITYTGSYSFYVRTLGDKTTTDNSAAEAGSAAYSYTNPIPAVAVPSGLAWDTAVPGKATWGAVSGAASYTVYLYRSSSTSAFDTETVAAGTTEYDFTGKITAGNSYKYTFTVLAKGDGSATPATSDSEESSPSAEYNYMKPLAAPTGLAWNTTIPRKATWGPVNGALGYIVKLYRSGTTDAVDTETIGTPANYDFTNKITVTGSYTFTVIARGNNSSSSNSPESSPSEAYSYTALPSSATVDNVSVSPSTASVEKGGSKTFGTTVTGTNSPAQTVTWNVTGNSSTSTKIDTDGKLTVGADETATALTVTATSTVDTGKSGTATVTVTTATPPTATVDNVAVSPFTASVEKGGSKTFGAAVSGSNSPAQTVTWSVTGNSSANTQIGTDGKLTIGTDETAATLTVTGTSTVDSGKSGTATVTVTTATPPTATVSSVTVSPSTASVEKGGNKIFGVTVTGTNSPAQTVTWSVTGNSANTKIGSDGKLTVGADETAATLTVTGTSTVDSGKFGTAMVTVTSVTLSAPTSIVWDTAIPGNATWGTVAGATGYTVNLYKSGTADAVDTESVAAGTTLYDFTNKITSTGSYTFKVIAKGDGTTTANSTESTAGAAYAYTVPSTMKTLVRVVPPSAVTGLVNGITKAAASLGLPTSVKMVTDNGDVNANVSWNVAACTYHTDEKAEQTFTVNGTVALPAGVVNTNNVSLLTSINVTVNAASGGDSSKNAISGFIMDYTTKTVPYGTDFASLNLPDKFKAVGAGITDLWVKVSKWVSSTFNSTVPGTYNVTAVLDSGYVDSGYVLGSAVKAPEIKVTVAAVSSDHHTDSSGSKSSSSTPDTGKTETKVDTTGNTATVITKPDSITTIGDTTAMEVTVPSVTIDNTATSTNGNAVDETKKTAVTVNIPTQDIVQQLAAKKDVDLTIIVPSDVAKDTNANVAVTINANKEILEAAKQNLSDVTIKIKDADTQQMAYSWTFKGEDLAKSTTPMTDVNIAMSVHLTTEVPKVNVITPEKKGLVLSFDHSGVLPSVASVTFSALEKGFKPGQTLYFYYYNPTTKQIESLGKDAYTVAADGSVTVQIYHCSDYVLLPNAARSITLDTRTYTMTSKKSYEIGVKLANASDTIIKVYSSAKGIANVTVLKNGNIKVTGVKDGLTYIMIDVYDKKNKFLTHASVRVTVQNGVKPNGNSARQYGIF